MSFFLEKRHDLFFRDSDGLIGNHVVESGYAHFGGAFVDSLLEFFLEHLRHPDHAQQAAVAEDKLALGDIVLE